MLYSDPIPITVQSITHEASAVIDLSNLTASPHPLPSSTLVGTIKYSGLCNILLITFPTIVVLSYESLLLPFFICS